MTAQPYRILWRSVAEDELNEIIHYIAQDSPMRAKKFGLDLYNKIHLLMQQPMLGRTGRPGLPDFMRELIVHKNYIVFYRVLDDTRTIIISNIKHTAQQWP